MIFVTSFFILIPYTPLPITNNYQDKNVTVYKNQKVIAMMETHWTLMHPKSCTNNPPCWPLGFWYIMMPKLRTIRWSKHPPAGWSNDLTKQPASIRSRTQERNLRSAQNEVMNLQSSQSSFVLHTFTFKTCLRQRIRFTLIRWILKHISNHWRSHRGGKLVMSQGGHENKQELQEALRGSYQTTSKVK